MAFSEAIKLEVKKRANLKCCLCHENWATEVHHIVPQAEGGPSTGENAAPLCARCHGLYGGNPDLRKHIRISRDMWYDFCEKESPLRAEQVQQMLDKFGKFVATKEDLQEAVSYLGGLIQNIMGQPLSTSTQAHLISDVTATFSDVIAISDEVTAELMTKCSRCGNHYPISEDVCPFCGAQSDRKQQ